MEGFDAVVGRMIRTPLARRIETNEVLNTVELFLPHYDSVALQGILSHLKNPEAEQGISTRVETSTEEYSRDSAFSEVFDYLATLPTYSVNRAARMGDVKRALRLAGLLVHNSLDKGADDDMRDVLTKKLKELRDACAASDPAWDSKVREGGEIEVDVTMLAIGQMSVTGQKVVKMSLSEQNIDQLFDAAGRKLAAGEGLHRSYWKRYHDQA